LNWWRHQTAAYVQGVQNRSYCATAVPHSHSSAPHCATPYPSMPLCTKPHRATPYPGPHQNRCYAATTEPQRHSATPRYASSGPRLRWCVTSYAWRCPSMHATAFPGAPRPSRKSTGRTAFREIVSVTLQMHTATSPWTQ